MPDVVAVGNAIVDRTYEVAALPTPDGGAFAEAVTERPGGVAANVAATLRGIGRDVGVIARLGDDDIAAAVLADLDARGVDRTRVRVVPDDRSSYCVVLRDRDGQRMIVGAGESTQHLRLDAGDAAYLGGAAAVFTSGYAPPAVLESLADWRRAGRVSGLAFDIAGTLADIEPRGHTRAGIDSVLPAVDCVIGNRSALGSYVRADALDDIVDALRDRGATRGAVTCGPDGAVLFDRTDRTDVPAVDVTVLDTTGAGDSFSAGLIDAWLLEGASMERAGRFAAAAAAHTCTAVGARGDVPSRTAIAELLDRP